MTLSPQVVGIGWLCISICSIASSGWNLFDKESNCNKNVKSIKRTIGQHRFDDKFAKEAFVTIRGFSNLTEEKNLNELYGKCRVDVGSIANSSYPVEEHKTSSVNRTIALYLPTEGKVVRNSIQGLREKLCYFILIVIECYLAKKAFGFGSKFKIFRAARGHRNGLHQKHG